MLQNVHALSCFTGYALPAHTLLPTFLRPSGVVPVFLPYTTLDVMVRTDSVGMLLRYVVCVCRCLLNVSATQVAISSTSSSSLPYLGKLPSTCV